MRISDWSSDVCSSDLNLELVHRLDRDTSGVLVLAKKRSALLELQRQMREGGIRKRYLALLVGRMAESFTVDVALQKSVLSGGERMVRVDAEIGRAACRERVCQYV